MTERQLKDITAEFEEIKSLISQRESLSRSLNKVRRKLKSQIQRYSFVKDMVGLNSKSLLLVTAVKNFFLELGCTVEEIPEKIGEEDLRIWDNKRLIIVEVTGTYKSSNSENKAHQISKHIPLKQERFPNHKVYGLFVSNHNAGISFDMRNISSFDKRINKISKAHGYTVTTTIDLLNAFVQIKNGTLTKLEFLDELCSSGILKYRAQSKSNT